MAFHRCNFLHLTGVKVNERQSASAIHFYEKCLARRLTEHDFDLAGDGSTAQKLSVLEQIMLLKKNVIMIGDFTDRGPKLFTEKIAGNVNGCIGFVRDRNTGLNVPNTLLKKDIRDVTASPVQKIYLVFSKSYGDERYSVAEKVDKSINIDRCHFKKEIENMIDLSRRKCICIRPMTPSDLPAVGQLEQQCFSDAWSRKLLEDGLNCEFDRFFVAELEGKVCGYANLRVIAGEGEIERIAVDSRFRRMGIGRKLMEKMEESARDAGVGDMTLEVRESNGQARKLYETCGFKEEGRRKRYYRNPEEDAVIMWRRKT